MENIKSNVTSDRGQYTIVEPDSDSQTATMSQSRIASPRVKSWRAPKMMTAFLLLGLGVALAHHFMHVNLNMKEVEKVSPSQAWVSRFSTALAFLVKALFTVSVGVAFVQQHWLKLHRQSFTVREIDIMTSALSNILHIFRTTIWLRNPSLIWMFIVAWLIPLAAVVAPGSLLVESRDRSNSTMIQVPQLSFLKIGNLQAHQSGYEATSDRLYKLAYRTASSAQPVPLQSKYSRENYTLSFYGPAVKCGGTNNSMIEGALSNLGNKLANENTVTFASWVAGDEDALNSTTTTSYAFETLDRISTDAARIFVMTSMAGQDTSSNISSIPNANICECLLYNATYDVNFTFHSPDQVFQSSISDYLNPIPSFYQAAGISNDSRSAILVSYSSIMDAYGKLLVGLVQSESGIERSLFTTSNLLNIDWADAQTVVNGLEQLFQNLTLSLLSDGELLKGSTEAGLTAVTVTDSRSTYIYDSDDLLIAYGISLGCTIVCWIIGMHAFLVNNNSYQHMFSSFVRAINDHELGSMIDRADGGADPLPKELSGVRLTLKTQQISKS